MAVHFRNGAGNHEGVALWIQLPLWKFYFHEVPNRTSYVRSWSDISAWVTRHIFVSALEFYLHNISNQYWSIWNAAYSIIQDTFSFSSFARLYFLFFPLEYEKGDRLIKIHFIPMSGYGIYIEAIKFLNWIF